ncbi:N5-glutamine methyltransferase family protein [Paenibacillus methanolicus]|uniref:Release factor glutamine methyltransferase n=1 Tax=Paenibacillus methanolicus TaxID=582686 RepID=A0A5S5C896_9BACL|nr:HemK/PrmC family methyltransferase [Paenibacillus methanolicus]TYP75625.1 release factor glutamine methyltransferase [Paenibacillus methanolicus]
MTSTGMTGYGGGSAPNETIGARIVQAVRLLAEQGIGEPRENAERLMMHLLGADRARLLMDWGEPLPPERAEAWQALVARKAEGEPLQYIVGEQWFYGLPYAVTPAVLIPRPETELLVEAVLEAVDRLWPGAAGVDAGTGQASDGQAAPMLLGSEGAVPSGADAAAESAPDGAGSPAVPTVLDVGTGSGAIAVTLAALRPAWRVVASDLSPDALGVARANAARHGAAARLRFAQGDLLAPFLARREGEAVADGGDGLAGLRIDVLVSNPPYIPARDIEDLQTEVRDYEPRLALDGGEDGLNPYRAIVEQLPKLAALPRIVAFELGMGQAEAVADLLRGLGAWSEIRIIRDYGGIDRHVMAIAPYL